MAEPFAASEELLRGLQAEREERLRTLGKIRLAAAVTIQGAARRRALLSRLAKAARYEASVDLLRAAGKVVRSQASRSDAPRLSASSAELRKLKSPHAAVTPAKEPPQPRRPDLTSAARAAHYLEVLSRLRDGLASLGDREVLSVPVALRLVDRLAELLTSATDEASELRRRVHSYEKQVYRMVPKRSIDRLLARLKAEGASLVNMTEQKIALHAELSRVRALHAQAFGHPHGAAAPRSGAYGASGGVQSARRASRDDVGSGVPFPAASRAEPPQALARKYSMERMRAIDVLRGLDTDGDGLVSRPELRRMLTSVGMSEGEISQAFMYADRNNSGRLDLRELKRLLNALHSTGSLGSPPLAPAAGPVASPPHASPNGQAHRNRNAAAPGGAPYALPPAITEAVDAAEAKPLPHRAMIKAATPAAALGSSQKRLLSPGRERTSNRSPDRSPMNSPPQRLVPAPAGVRSPQTPLSPPRVASSPARTKAANSVPAPGAGIEGLGAAGPADASDTSPAQAWSALQALQQDLRRVAREQRAASERYESAHREREQLQSAAAALAQGAVIGDTKRGLNFASDLRSAAPWNTIAWDLASALERTTPPMPPGQPPSMPPPLPPDTPPRRSRQGSPDPK